MSRPGLSPHDELELRVAEALTGETPLDATLLAHVEACPTCAALASALHALGRDAREGDPDEAYWRGFDERLRDRLPALPPVALRRPQGPRPLLAGLAIAAAVAAVALALWVLRPAPRIDDGDGAGDDAPEAAASSGVPANEILASASEDSLELGIRSLGLGDAWDDESVVTPLADSDVAAVTAAPAWGDALGALEEELAALDPSEQEALAQALREAT